MPEVISLATAKLLHECEKCVDVDDIIDDNHHMEYEYYYCPDGGYGEELLDHDYAIATRIDRNGWPTYPAYPLSQVKRYLIDYHNIIVESVYNSGYEKPNFRFKVHIIDGDTRKLIEQTEDFDQDYEKALDLGFRVAFEQIMK